MAGGNSSLERSNKFKNENDENNDEGTKTSFDDAREFPESIRPNQNTCM